MDIQYPLYRDDLFSKAKRLSDYEKLKVLHRAICWQLEHAPDVDKLMPPRNPRQTIFQNHHRKNKLVWQRQKVRLEEKMKLMEEQIQKDMTESK